MAAEFTMFLANTGQTKKYLTVEYHRDQKTWPGASEGATRGDDCDRTNPRGSSTYVAGLTATLVCS
jgi:hypothetical protein